MEKADVLVVGAGPAGLYLAGLLEKSGRTVRILEEHERVGGPNHCSGLVSRNLGLFVHPKREWIEHKVSGAVVRAGYSSIRLRKHHTAAYVIDRSGFDASLASGLSSISLGARAENISAGKDGVSVKTTKGVFRAQMLAGCDGASSVVARHFQSRPKQLLMGVIGITWEENYSPDVEIIIDKALAKDGFFWKIPRGRTTEYGLFSSKADFLDLEDFFKIKPMERRAGLIPLGPGKSYFERALLVGDSAGMSKPWSGGGLIYGLTAARIAAITILEAFEQDDFSEGFLARYERGWKGAFGRQIQAGMLGRRIFEQAGDFEVELALKTMGIFNPLLNGMDMDFLVR
jgi:digeranylgeranylglycerophospholipid reductase